MQNIDLASNATNGWWLDELFGTDIIQISNGKRLKMSHQQFIETLIQSGCLDGIWEEDLFPTVVTRDGRTEKIDYFTDTKWGRDIYATLGLWMQNQSKAKNFVEISEFHFLCLQKCWYPNATD